MTKKELEKENKRLQDYVDARDAQVSDLHGEIADLQEQREITAEALAHAKEDVESYKEALGHVSDTLLTAADEVEQVRRAYSDSCGIIWHIFSALSTVSSYNGRDIVYVKNLTQTIIDGLKDYIPGVEQANKTIADEYYANQNAACDISGCDCNLDGVDDKGYNPYYDQGE